MNYQAFIGTLIGAVTMKSWVYYVSYLTNGEQADAGWLNNQPLAPSEARSIASGLAHSSNLQGQGYGAFFICTYLPGSATFTPWTRIL
jgi:hypothetical protein